MKGVINVTCSCPPEKKDSIKKISETYQLGRDVFLDLNSGDSIGKVVAVNDQRNQFINVDISVDITSEAGRRFYKETDVNTSIDKLHL